MTDDCGDLDPYLASLFVPRFSRPEVLGHHAGMEQDPTIPISQDDLAREAGRWFSGARIEDVPAKLWLDCHAATGQIYLRATFDRGLRDISKVRLAGMAVSLDELFGTELVTIAYPEDYTWPEIEGWNRALNEVL